MPIQIKKPAPTVIQDSLPLPPSFPDLPDDVLARFPSLAKWEEDTTAWYKKLGSAIQDGNRTISQTSTKTTVKTDLLGVRITEETSERETADGWLEGKYTLTVIAGDVVTGMEITSATGPNAGIVSDVTFQADRFMIYSGTTKKLIFQADAIQNKVRMAGVFTVDGGSNSIYVKTTAGAGTYNDAATPFFVDDNSFFSLGDKLTWNPMTATLTITGSISATTGSIGGFNIGTDYIRDAANSMGLASTVTGGDDVRFWAGATFASRGTAPFRVTEAGVMTASSGTFSGALSGATGTFSGSLSAATGTFSGSLSAATGTFSGSLSAATGTFSGSLSAATGTFAGALSAATGTFSGTLDVGTGDDHVVIDGTHFYMGNFGGTTSVFTLSNAGGDAQIVMFDSAGRRVIITPFEITVGDPTSGAGDGSVLGSAILTFRSDTNIYRGAPNILSTDDSFTVGKIAVNTTGVGFYAAPTGELASVVNGGGISTFVRLDADGAIINFSRDGSSVVGSVSVTTTATAYNTSSDRRLKKNFVPGWSLGDAFDRIEIGEFDWKLNGLRGRGVLAQDLFEVFPDAVKRGDDEDPEFAEHPWSVDYGRLTIPLIAEVKALRARVKELEAIR